MAQIVNLRQARKSLKRAKDRAQANANAAKFGLTGAERSRIEAETRHAEARLSGHRIDRDDGPEDATKDAAKDRAGPGT